MAIETEVMNQDGGCANSAVALLTQVYDDLRRLAAARLSQEKPGQTLQATALVHEAFLRLYEDVEPQQWDNAGHFYTAVAEAMRRILIEQARRRKSQKRGGDFQRIEIQLNSLVASPVRSPEEILALDEAFDKLERDDPQAANIARLRIFAGLGLDVSAESLDMPRTTAYRHWTYARAFLQHELLTNQSGRSSQSPLFPISDAQTDH